MYAKEKELQENQPRAEVFIKRVRTNLGNMQKPYAISEVALGKSLSPDIRSDMTSIKLAGKRLSNQINNMLDYTEIVEGTLTPAKEEYMNLGIGHTNACVADIYNQVDAVALHPVSDADVHAALFRASDA